MGIEKNIASANRVTGTIDTKHTTTGHLVRFGSKTHYQVQGDPAKSGSSRSFYMQLIPGRGAWPDPAGHYDYVESTKIRTCHRKKTQLRKKPLEGAFGVTFCCHRWEQWSLATDVLWIPEYRRCGYKRNTLDSFSEKIIIFLWGVP